MYCKENWLCLIKSLSNYNAVSTFARMTTLCIQQFKKCLSFCFWTMKNDEDDDEHGNEHNDNDKDDVDELNLLCDLTIQTDQ